MFKFSYVQKFFILQSIFLSFMVFAWVKGWIKLVLESDTSNLSAFIFLTFLTSLYFVGTQNVRIARWIANRLVLMGLIGTLVGILVAMYNIITNFASIPDLQNVNNILNMIYGMFSGLYIAIYTSLVGSMGYLWTTTSLFILDSSAKET